MVTLMDDQNEAWRRLTDARLKALEHAVSPPRLRRRKDGRPLAPQPWEPGDREPLTKWLELRVLGLELLLRLLLDADEEQAEDLDIRSMERMMADDLIKLAQWSDRQIEPNWVVRLTMGQIRQASLILMEAHAWPLVEIEDGEGED